MLKKKKFSCIIAGLALAIIASSAPAQNPSADSTKLKINPASKARIKYIETFWDFGSVPKGYPVYHEFAVTNIGTDTLVITRVKPTCGCTAAPLSSDHIAPGDTAEISVTLNTAKLQGKVKKNVNVDCNDPVNPYSKLIFNAFVDNPDRMILCDPIEADFGNFKNGEKKAVTLTIKNADSSDVNLIVANKPPDDILTASIAKNQLQANDSTSLTLEIKAELQPGPFATTLALEAQGKPETRISIPIKGTVVE